MDLNSSRTSRSDEGIINLANSVFKEIFGLDPETTSRIMRIIRSQGEWLTLKQTVRNMSGVAHRRLNDVITMAQKNGEVPDELDGEQELNGEMDSFDHNHNQEQERPAFGEERQPYEGMTFAGYLLNELQYSDEDLRDPEKTQDIMRMMRASDNQAKQLINRGEKDQKQAQRDEIQQETDPQKAGLRRKKLALQRQIAQIDQQLAAPGAEQQTGFDTY